MTNLNQLKTLCCDTAQFFNLTDYVYQESISVNFMLHRAELGDTDAQRWLADSYYYGINGLTQNLQQALHWYVTASVQGDQIASQFLQVCLDCSNLASTQPNIEDWFSHLDFDVFYQQQELCA